MTRDFSLFSEKYERCSIELSIEIDYFNKCLGDDDDGDNDLIYHSLFS